MATPDQYLNPIDVKDSHNMTRLVERRVAETDQWNIPFAPLTSTRARKILLRVRHENGSGLAAFKADNADTPIVSVSGDITDVYMELFVIGEKSVIKQSDLVALESIDPLIAGGAAAEMVKKASRLRIRNMNRTKWMAWMAVRDELSVVYPDGTIIAIDYDLNGDAQNSWFSESHLVSAAAAWSNIATDIKTDVYDWSYIISEDLGVSQTEVVMYCSTATYRNIRKNTGINAELSSFQPRVLTATMAEVAQILEIGAVRIYNDFYVEQGTDTKTKYLGDGNVLFTGPDVVNGDPLVEMFDGPVARVVGEDIVVGNNPGALSEIYINKEQVVKNIRVQTARLPQVNYPAGLVWADITP